MLPIVVTMMVAILAMMALAVDGAFLFSRKTQLQNVADAAAIACASARQTNPANCTTGANPTLFNSLNPKAFTLNAMVTVSCPQAWQSQCVQVTASSNWGTFFLRAIGQSSINTTATAIAGRNNPCMFGLNNTGTQTNNNVNLVLGNNETATINCMIASRSTSSSSIRRGGNAQGIVSTTVGILTNGGITYASGTITSPSTTTYSSASLVDPYLTLAAPTPGVSQGNITINTCITVSPGTYNNLNINPPNNCSMTVSPGVYIVQGQLTLDTGNNGSSITGTDVFFYAGRTSAQPAASLSGAGGSLTLTARRYGSYANILIYAPSKRIIIQGNNATRTLNGSLYAPNSDITFNGNTGSSATTGNLIADSIEVNINLTVNDTSRIKLLQ